MLADNVIKTHLRQSHWVLAIRIIHDKMSIALQSGFPFHPIVLKLLYLAFNSVGRCLYAMEMQNHVLK